MRKTSYSCAALIALSCVSCSKENVHPVSGKVLCNGAPATRATVFLRPSGAKANHVLIGAVGKDGTFEIACGALGKGAPPGEYDVLIAWRAASNEATGCCERRTDKLGGRYSDPANPRFRATIKPGPNVLPPLELTD